MHGEPSYPTQQGGAKTGKSPKRILIPSAAALIAVIMAIAVGVLLGSNAASAAGSSGTGDGSSASAPATSDASQTSSAPASSSASQASANPKASVDSKPAPGPVKATGNTGHKSSKPTSKPSVQRPTHQTAKPASKPKQAKNKATATAANPHSVVTGTICKTAVKIYLKGTGFLPNKPATGYAGDSPYIDNPSVRADGTSDANGNISLMATDDTSNGWQVGTSYDWSLGVVGEPGTSSSDQNVLLVLTDQCGTPPPVNHAPKANDDTATTDENAAVTVPVLKNDTDQDGDTLSVATFGKPAHGTTVLSSDGKQVMYTPASGFSGTDSFTYTAGDGKAGSNTATVTVTVKPVVTPPGCDQTATATYNGSMLHVVGVLCADGYGTTYTTPTGCDGTFGATCVPQNKYASIAVPKGDYSKGRDFSLASPTCGYYQWDLYTGPEQTTVDSSGTKNGIIGVLVNTHEVCTTPPTSTSPAPPTSSQPVPPTHTKSTPVTLPSSSHHSTHHTVVVHHGPNTPGTGYPVQSSTSGHGTPWYQDPTDLTIIGLGLIGAAGAATRRKQISAAFTTIHRSH